MHIALVDPSRTVLMSVTRLLEARGHVVHAFHDAAAALSFVKAHEAVDALIASAELGTMSGIELCWEARSFASTQRPLYVILMSSSRERHKLGEALDSGADDFIGKPPVAEELYARLRAAERLAAMQRELVRLAYTDSLTGLLNRRAFFEKAETLLARDACGAVVSAVMLDVDHFKRINDVHGHDIGDQVLAAVAARLAAAEEIAGRLGGEEFAVLLDGRGGSEAAEAAEELRAQMAMLRFTSAKGDFAITCSFGVSERRAGEGVEPLLKRADNALYAAKAAGRDRVSVA